MTYRVLIYAAVSTEAQATEDKASLDVQLTQCRAVCAARGWHIVATVRVEGHSRNYEWLHQLVADSPEYGEFIAAVESETADLVVARDYDRLWRTDALRAQVTALCRQHHVQIFSCNQPVEPVDRALLADTDTARMSEVLFGFISEQESRTRTRRHRVGMEGRVLRRGLHHATHVPFGYQRGPSPLDPLVPVEPQAGHVRWMFERRAEGWSYNRIADVLNERGVRPTHRPAWIGSIVADMLHNDFYRGVAYWGSVRNEHGAHVALVDADVWARVQVVNRSRTAIRAGFETVERLLLGLVKCGHCGWSCGYLVKRADPRRYLRCVRHARCRAECLPNMWRAETVEDYVLNAVKGALANPAAWEAARNEAAGNGARAARLATLDSQLADAEQRRQRWDALYESGGIGANELLLHRQEIIGQMTSVAAERAAIAEDMRACAATRTQLDEMAGVLPLLDRLPLSEQRAVLRALIARVRLYQTPERRIEIDWL